MAASTSSCPVCIESYNRTIRKEAECQYCHYSVCRSCLQQYLLNTTEDPHCMSCKKKWNREILDELISKAFRNTTFKKRREVLLLEREKALLPATQREAYRQKRTKELTSLKRELNAQLRAINEEYYTLNQENTSVVRQRSFTIHCPVQNCRGYVSAGEWTCGTCNIHACRECFAVKEEGHQCQPDAVETARTLRAETRSCPSCSTLIYRISGCDQMWCTQCHTAFNWRTGQVCAGVVHNPHFYEWQMRNGPGANTRRAAGDIPCGGLPDIYRLRHALFDFYGTINPHWVGRNRTYNTLPEEVKCVYEIHRITLHIEQVIMTTYRVNDTSNLQLRVDYLNNEFTEEEFMHKLQQREKQLAKKREIYDVFEMYVFTMVDMFRNLLGEIANQNYKTLEDLTPWFNQVKQLETFANEQFDKIAKRYSNTVPKIELTEVFKRIERDNSDPTAPGPSNS